MISGPNNPTLEVSILNHLLKSKTHCHHLATAAHSSLPPHTPAKGDRVNRMFSPWESALEMVELGKAW